MTLLLGGWSKNAFPTRKLPLGGREGEVEEAAFDRGFIGIPWRLSAGTAARLA